MIIKFEYIIIAVLSLLLFIECQRDKDCDPVMVQTEVSEKIVKSKDSFSDPGIKNRVPEKIHFRETPEKIEVVSNPEKLAADQIIQLSSANRYIDTTYFAGATIFSDIISEGRILRKDLKAEIEHKETTTTITETRENQPVGLFFAPGIGYSPLLGVEQIEGEFTFIRGNWGAGIGGYYDLYPGSLGFKIKLLIKL